MKKSQKKHDEIDVIVCIFFSILSILISFYFGYIYGVYKGELLEQCKNGTASEFICYHENISYKSLKSITLNSKE